MARHRRRPAGPSNRPPERSPEGSEDDRVPPELVPLVLPEDGSRRLGFRGPGLGRMARWILAGLLLVGILIWPLGILDWPLDGESGATAARNAAGQDPAPERFSVLLDSLESSLTVLRTRHDDHERGRITCDELVPAYRRLDDVVVSLAIARSEAGPPDPEAAESYEELIAEAEAEERKFERTGCPRP